MNALVDTYGDQGFSCLAFPSNQFGHQENTKESEILATLKYVRPGDGYEPKFPIFGKVECNGENEAPVFTFLKTACPFASDTGPAGELIGNAGGSSSGFTKVILWRPIKRYDLSWNFEKFLVNQDGVPVKRYSPGFETKDVASDIAALLKDPQALS